MSGKIRRLWARIRRRGLLELSPDPERLLRSDARENGVVLALKSFTLFLIEAAQHIPQHQDGWGLSRVEILPNPSRSSLFDPGDSSALRYTSGGLVCCITDGGDKGREVAIRARIWLHNHKDGGEYDGFTRKFILSLYFQKGFSMSLDDDVDRSVTLHCRPEVEAVARFDFEEQWRSWNNLPNVSKPKALLFSKFENRCWKDATLDKEVWR